MPAELATGRNLKRVKVFIGANGQKYEGNIEDYKNNPKIIRDDKGGNGLPDRVAEKAGTNKKA